MKILHGVSAERTFVIECTNLYACVLFWVLISVYFKGFQCVSKTMSNCDAQWEYIRYEDRAFTLSPYQSQKQNTHKGLVPLNAGQLWEKHVMHTFTHNYINTEQQSQMWSARVITQLHSEWEYIPYLGSMMSNWCEVVWSFMFTSGVSGWWWLIIHFN